MRERYETEKDIAHYCETQHDNNSSKNTQVTHSLFVCEEKAKVSLAKSSLFSNCPSFALVQKLFSERSSGPI